MAEQTQADWFQNPGSRAWAVVAMIAGTVVAVIAALNGSVAVALGGVLFALLSHASMWRPAVGVDGESLLLREMYSTLVLPLSAIESVTASRMFTATVAGRRYTTSALSRGYRQARRQSRTEDLSYQDRVEIEIRSHIERSSGGPTGRVRRHWAWVDVVLSAVVFVAFVVSIIWSV